MVAAKKRGGLKTITRYGVVNVTRIKTETSNIFTMAVSETFTIVRGELESLPRAILPGRPVAKLQVVRNPTKEASPSHLSKPPCRDASSRGGLVRWSGR